jgi:Trk-type K+ transport system membrane component
MSFIQRFREWVNVRIYGSKERVLRGLRITTLLVSLMGVGVLVSFHGFSLSVTDKESLLTLMRATFVFFIVRYLVGILYTFEMKKFFQKTWFEGIMMLALVIAGVSYYIRGTSIITDIIFPLWFDDPKYWTAILFHFIFLLIVTHGLARSSDITPRIKIHPTHLFLLTFLLIIMVGTVGLLLPEMTVQAGSMPFIDALYTATSASTVTGLIVVDTATYFTLKGHILIMILIKLGALNLIAFGAFLALASKFRIGIRYHEFNEDYFGQKTMTTQRGLFGKIILWSLAIEAIGFLFMFLSWSADYEFKNIGERVFFSLFHSVSAFNSAGFSLFTNGFYHEVIRFNYWFHIAVIFLMFLGSLGMAPIFEMFSWSKVKERIRLPWKKMDINTRIALNFLVIITLVIFLAFLILEWNHSLKDKSFGEALITGLFQAMTPRTIGFNTVDTGSLTIPVLIIFCCAMFIGATAGSSGGGIKTSTFAVIWALFKSIFTGKRDVELYEKTVPESIISKAGSIFFLYVAGIFVGVFLLSITEGHILAQEGRSLLDLIFEQTSAFTTTGLSTGITPELSHSGRIIAIVSMFIGRVGTISVFYLFVRERITDNRYKYPDTHIFIG